MADERCSCGFTEVAGVGETIGDHLRAVFTPEDDGGVDETIGDHLRAVFTPEHGPGADWRVHLEGDPVLTWLCGFRAGTTGELDSHFLEMFARLTGWTPMALSTR